MLVTPRLGWTRPLATCELLCQDSAAISVPGTPHILSVLRGGFQDEHTGQPLLAGDSAGASTAGGTRVMPCHVLGPQPGSRLRFIQIR